MKSWKLVIALQLLLAHPTAFAAGDLEDTIDKELQKGSSSKGKDEDIVLDDGDEVFYDENAPKDEPIDADLEAELNEGKSKKAKPKAASEPAPAKKPEPSAAAQQHEQAQKTEDEQQTIDSPETTAAPETTAETEPHESEDGDENADLDKELEGGEEMDGADEAGTAAASSDTEKDEESQNDTDDSDVAGDEETPPVEAAPPVKRKKSPKKDIYAETLGTFDDQVNSEFENRLYRIFSGDHSRLRAQYDDMVGQRASEIYKIQPGDTLWDVSRTFFGDGSFWPRLWSENATLTNPHEISVGNALAFLSGTEESAPIMTVTPVRIDKATTPVPRVSDADPDAPVYPQEAEAPTADEIAAGTVLEEPSIAGGKPEIPAPLTAIKPLLKGIPNSFITAVPPKVEEQYDGTGLDVGRRKAVDEPATVYAFSYISDRDPATVGTIKEMQSQDRTAGTLQKVLIKGDRDLSVGERFTAVMNRGSVTNKQTGTFGPVFEVGGLIEVSQVLDAGRKLYKGVVIRSINPIETNAILTEEPMPKVNYSLKAPHSEVQARVIGGEQSAKRRFIGSGSVVYLDEGSKAGLAEGQLLALRSSRVNRHPDTGFASVAEPSAILKIVRVYPRVSTAMILNAYDEIQPGDITGGPFPHPETELTKKNGRFNAVDVTAKMSGSNEDSFGEDELDDAAE